MFFSVSFPFHSLNSLLARVDIVNILELDSAISVGKVVKIGKTIFLPPLMRVNRYCAFGIKSSINTPTKGTYGQMQS